MFLFFFLVLTVGAFEVFPVYGDVLQNEYLLFSEKDVNNLNYNLVSERPDILITPFSERIGVTWQNGHVFEKHLIEKFYALLKEHDGFFVAIDVGAQTGCFTLLSKFFPNSKWYAFEPIKEAIDCLSINLTLNDIQNVSVYQMALSDFSGTAILKMPPLSDLGCATIGSKVYRFSPVSEREVRCTKLDNFANEHHIEKVHFIKIDAEGAELQILNGARKTILRDRPIILMEYYLTNMAQCDTSEEEVNAFLEELGYAWHFIASSDILCLPK